MTQGELAKQLGIRQNTLSTWETGRYEPDNEMLRKLARIFGVSVGYVLGDDSPWEEMPGDQIDYLRMIRLLRTVQQLTPSQYDEVLEYATKIMVGEHPSTKIENGDTVILTAYRAAPPEIRAIIDTALAPYHQNAIESSTA